MAGAQRNSIAAVASVITVSNVRTFDGRKAGAHIRRCAAHSAPELVSNPLPSSGRSM